MINADVRLMPDGHQICST